MYKENCLKISNNKIYIQNIMESVMKVCSKCKVEKVLNLFSKNIHSKSGFRSDCNECRKINRSKPENKEKEREQYKEYYHRPEVKKRYNEYRNTDQVKERMNEWREANKEKIQQQNKDKLPQRKLAMKEKYNTDKNYQLITILRSKIHKMLKGVKTSYVDILGCNLFFLKKWLAFRFDSNMTWENLGSYWEIDHILPISSFKMSDNNSKNICFHWTNLQPLVKEENRSKKDKLQLHYYFNNIVNVSRFHMKYKQFLGYQALNESLKWLRDNELRYGKNPTYDLDFLKSNEIGNPQPSL